MATSFQWKIMQLQAIPQAGGLEKIVNRIMGTLTATSDDGIEASQLVNVQAGPYDAASFIAYEELTEAVVVSWLEECMGADALASLKGILVDRIAEARDLRLTPPWIQPQSPVT